MILSAWAIERMWSKEKLVRRLGKAPQDHGDAFRGQPSRKRRGHRRLIDTAKGEGGDDHQIFSGRRDVSLSLLIKGSPQSINHSLSDRLFLFFFHLNFSLRHQCTSPVSGPG